MNLNNFEIEKLAIDYANEKVGNKAESMSVNWADIKHGFIEGFKFAQNLQNERNKNAREKSDVQKSSGTRERGSQNGKDQKPSECKRLPPGV